MNNEFNLFNILKLIIPGGICVYGLWKRFATFNTQQGRRGWNLNLIAFSVVFFGLLLSFPEYCAEAGKSAMNTSVGKFLFVSAVVFLPILIYVAYKILTSYYDVGDAFLTVRYIPVRFILWGVIMFTLGATFVNNSDQTMPDWIAALIFLTIFIFIGFLHGLFGPFLSAFNIALIVSTIMNGNDFPFRLSTVFDFLSFLSCDKPIVQYAVAIVSSIAGAVGYLREDFLGKITEWVHDKISS